jgi:nitrilase
MPLARYAVYRGGPQIWAAPTMDDSDAWVALMRTIAFESSAWVVSVCQVIHGEDFPADFPFELPGGRNRVLSHGNSVIVHGGTGDVVAGPLEDEEGILVADCDLRETLRAKQWFDAVGHYSREDVLLDVLDPGDAANGGYSKPPAGSTRGLDSQALTP